LATGGIFVTLSLYFARGESTVRKIIKETTEIIWNVLKDIHMPVPTQDQFKHIADRFELLWNLPNCIGALDGKHIRIEKFLHTGSENFNYKHFHSTVLMACCDADGLFTVIEPGFAGRKSDGGIFKACATNYWITHGDFNIPLPSPLRHDERNTPFPYYFVGDEAFPLKPYLLRPYSRNSLGDNEPNKIFNYRLSRARRVVENAFGILAARWRCFRGHIEVQPEFVDKIVLASCCLHNMLCTDNEFEPDLELNQVPENAFLNIDALRRNSTREATQIRDAFKDYFNSDAGSVVWQVDSVRKGRIHT